MPPLSNILFPRAPSSFLNEHTISAASMYIIIRYVSITRLLLSYAGYVIRAIVNRSKEATGPRGTRSERGRIAWRPKQWGTLTALLVPLHEHERGKGLGRGWKGVTGPLKSVSIVLNQSNGGKSSRGERKGRAQAGEGAKKEMGRGGVRGKNRGGNRARVRERDKTRGGRRNITNQRSGDS